MLVIPIGDRIIVSFCERETEMDGVLLTEDTEIEELQKAIVVTEGVYCVNDKSISLNQGDYVWFSRQSARQFNYKSEEGGTVQAYIVNMRDLYAIAET